MHYYLVPYALQRHVRQTMQDVVTLTRVDMHLGQSENVYLYSVYKKKRKQHIILDN